MKWIAYVGIGLAGLGVLTGLAEERIVVTEHLNRRWTHEWVAYPFAAQAPDVQLTGPSGSIPVQVSGSNVTFIVDELAPLATNIYTVSRGKSVASDLVITPAAERVEVVSSRFGVRLLVGDETYDPPAVSSNVPGPVAGMRLADGTWFGGSRLYGEALIAGYSAKLTDAGPVFARVECRYRYADGRTNTVTVQLNSQGDRLYFNDRNSGLSESNGWELTLNGLPALAFQYMPEQGAKQPKAHLIQGDWKEVLLADCPAGLITKLYPWGDWTDEFTQTTLFLAFPNQRELVIRRLNAGAWVRPGGGISLQQAAVPLMKAADSTVFLHVSAGTDQRVWTVGENASSKAKLARVFAPRNVMQDEMEDLNFVKDMVLDWPDSGKTHPNLFLSAEEFAAAGVRNPAALKTLQDVKTLRELLGSYVFFDTMRQGAAAICLYDAIIDSTLITPAERKLFRSQMAYLAYRLASPANWSTAHGYNSGNPNMTVAHTVNQGLAACVLSDHPMAKQWGAPTVAAMDGWLNRLDSAGHWPESSGYARVAESKMVYAAIALHRAELRPFLSDPRFKHMALYYERTLTPPDPQRLAKGTVGGTPFAPRCTPPYGRGGNGQTVGLAGMIASATAKLDPAFSRLMQWSYVAGGFSTYCGEPMYGYDQLISNPTLPAEQPTTWNSELLPSVGAMFRSGLGTPEENYLLLVSKNATNPDGEIWPSEVGALTIWFDHGQPLTREFPAGSLYPNLHGLLLNRVLLANNYKQGGKAREEGYAGPETMTGFATLPRLDYIGERYTWQQKRSAFGAPPPTVPDFPTVAREGDLPEEGVTWHRQALYVRDALPSGKNYLVLRDTVVGGQPTQWQFWTLSKSLSRVDDNHYATIGQFGVDLDYYIASPLGTPRNTLRHAYDAPAMGAVSGFRCEQDLLHLQMPGDGAYFVALVPRATGEPAPTFTTLADGNVIKVGNDYAFLADASSHATAEGAVFSGTVASIQDRTNELVLALGAAGSVAYKEYGISAAMPASLRMDAKGLTVSLPAQHAAGQVTVTAPGGWKADKGVSVVATKKTEYQLTVPTDVPEVRLLRTK